MITIKVWILFLTAGVEDSPGSTNPLDIAIRYPANLPRFSEQFRRVIERSTFTRYPTRYLTSLYLYDPVVRESAQPPMGPADGGYQAQPESLPNSFRSPSRHD